MSFDAKQNYFETNPAFQICEYHDVDWDTVCWLDWQVPYETLNEKLVENRKGEWISIQLYRMPSGRYEAVHYNAGK